MAIFYLLPPRSQLGDQFAAYLQKLFPGLDWDVAMRHNLAEALGQAVLCHPDVYVVFRDELPEADTTVQALAYGYGAESGDEVVEVRVGVRPGEVVSRRWRMIGQAA